MRMLVTQNTETGGAQQQVLSETGVLAEPAGGEDPQKVAAGKDQHIALDTAQTVDHSIRSITDLSQRLAAGAAITKKLPSGSGLLNLGCPQTFVISVVPFDQVRIHFRDCFEARKFAGQVCSFQSASQYLSECSPCQNRTQVPGFLFALGSEGKIRQTGMLPGKAPGCLSVPDQANDRKLFVQSNTIPFSICRRNQSVRLLKSRNIGEPAYGRSRHGNTQAVDQVADAGQLSIQRVTLRQNQARVAQRSA